jgi:hypothetical protein
MRDRVAASLRGGIRSVNRAPAILVGLWLMTIAAALPLAETIRTDIMQHLGSSVEADVVSEGVDYEWMQEFGARAAGVDLTFKPSLIGFAGVIDATSAVLDRRSQPAAIVTVGAIYVGLWLYLTGGIIDRFSRGAAATARDFWRACTILFGRIVSLAAIEAVAYGLLFVVVRGWLFDRVQGDAGRLAVDRRTFVTDTLVYLLFVLLLGAANLLFDYAKVCAVAGGRRGAVPAIRAAASFLRHEYAAAVPLYALDAALFLALVALYGAVAPEVGRGALVWIAVALAALFLLARLWIKLLFWASEVTLFRDRQPMTLEPSSC